MLIKIDGIVDAEMTQEEFWDKFIDFIEENNSSFGGSISELGNSEEGF